MADDLKNTGKGNLFVIFGEPDIDLIEKDGKLRVKVNGVDVVKPQTGEVISDNADGIACWFIDTDYNEESFFVQHPTSSAPTILTVPSRRRLRQKSTPKHGRRCTATPHARSTSQRRAASQ